MRRASSGGLIAALLLAAGCAGAAAPSGGSAMLNGTWRIELPASVRPDRDEDAFLPAGTLVHFSVDGPSRAAVDEGRDNELGGTMTLLPPFAAEICAAAIARDRCRDGHIADPQAPIMVDVTMQVEEWSRKDFAAPGNGLFAEQGAGDGARMVIVTATDGPSWTLWLQHRSVMLGQYLGTDGGRPVAVPQRWSRAAP